MNKGRYMLAKFWMMIFISMLWGSIAHAGAITLYTSLEPAEIADYVAAAKQDMPDLKLNIVRMSTGDLGARLLAERKRPRTDVIWGWALTDMLNPHILSMLEENRPHGLNGMPDRFKDNAGLWFAPTGYMAAFCVNTRRLQQKNLPMPTSWKDLAAPAFHNEVVMPNPVSSGTGYLQVASILQGFGEQKGWHLLESLNANVGQYSKSGSRPCSMVSMGEYTVGASSAIAAAEAIRQGYPVKMVIPSEGAGYELEANALMKSSQHKADAKRFLNWTLSATAARLYLKYKTIVWSEFQKRGDSNKLPHIASHLDQTLFDMDFVYSSRHRSEIIAAWRQRIEFARHTGKGN